MDGLKAYIAAVMAVSQVQAAGTADLSGDIVHAVEGPGGDTDGTGEVDAGFHQGIQHPAGIETAESTTLQNDTSFRQVFRCQTLREAVQSGKNFILFTHSCHSLFVLFVRKTEKNPPGSPYHNAKKIETQVPHVFFEKMVLHN